MMKLMGIDVAPGGFRSLLAARRILGRQAKAEGYSVVRTWLRGSRLDAEIAR